jgi:hypothetical protein
MFFDPLAQAARILGPVRSPKAFPPLRFGIL